MQGSGGHPSPPTRDDGPVWQIWLSAFHAPAMAIADELGIFRELRHTAADATGLARTLGLEPRAVEALTGLMASLGLLACIDGRYHLTDVARLYLTPDSPYYWGPFLKRIRENPIDCLALIDSIRRGTSAADGRITSLWEAGKLSPERLRAFTHAMHAHSFALAMSVTPAMELSGGLRFLDVGGGSGSFSIAASAHHRDLRCAVLDLPPVCEVALEYVRRHGASERVDVVPLDMFVEPWPTGFDRVFFSDILHDWDDDRCRFLADRAFAALPSGGRVLVHEMLLSDAKDGPLAAASYSVVMVFVAQGRQRTGRELIDILSAAGFTDPRITTTANGYATIEAVKP